MSFALPFPKRLSRKANLLVLMTLLLSAAAVISSVYRRPRRWRVGEVPVAFWAWRMESPNAADIRAAMERTGARTLFLRSGQIDFHNGKLRRIRAVRGAVPAGIDLHFVYNATPSLLAELDHVDEKALALSIVEAFTKDVQRVDKEHTRVAGLQLDIDVPTRLLGKYDQLLRILRAQLNPDTQLSITGLPTWMDSPALKSTLKQVDFWVPQFYGSEIPERVEQMIPISSPRQVENFVTRARLLDKPFYAGLAAYSWVLLYDASGKLLTLRGNLDPGLIAADKNFELIEQQPFEPTKGSSEWREVYQALAAAVIDGLVIHEGDRLVVDMPTAESLRASAAVVRSLAGEKLLGICVFRLPSVDDSATLTSDQIAAALKDTTATPEFVARLTNNGKQPGNWFLEIENQGTAGAINPLKLTLPIEPGSLEWIPSQRGLTFETICGSTHRSSGADFQPCSQNRANLIRIVAPGLAPGRTITISFVLKTRLPDAVLLSIEAQTDTGQLYAEQRPLSVKGELK